MGPHVSLAEGGKGGFACRRGGYLMTGAEVRRTRAPGSGDTGQVLPEPPRSRHGRHHDTRPMYSSGVLFSRTERSAFLF